MNHSNDKLSRPTAQAGASEGHSVVGRNNGYNGFDLNRTTAVNGHYWSGSKENRKLNNRNISIQECKLKNLQGAIYHLPSS